MNGLIQNEFLVEGLYVKAFAPTRLLFAPAILFIHGSCHGAFCWESWQRRFAQWGWRSHALSLRNHPGSYALSDDVYCRLTVFDYVEDCRTVLRAIGGPPPVVVGHSLGGVVAQKLAEILCAAGEAPPALVGLASSSPKGVGAVRDHALPEDKPIAWTRETARRLLFSSIPDDVYDAFYPRLVPESPSVQNWTGGGRTPVDPAVMTAPSLFVGAQMDASGVHKAERLAAFYGGHHAEIPGAGHNLMMEPMEAGVAAMIQAWLAATVGVEGIPAPQRAARLEASPGS